MTIQSDRARHNRAVWSRYTGPGNVAVGIVSKINNDGTIVFDDGKVARVLSDERYKRGDHVVCIIDAQGNMNIMAGQKKGA